MLHIKKYANGRFFDTENKKYIKQDQLAKMIDKGEEIKITLTKTGKDVTDAVIAELTEKKTDKKAAPKAADKKSKAGAKKEAVKKDKKEKADKKSKRNGKIELPFLKTDKLVKWVGDLVDEKINKVLDIVKLPSREQVARLDENIQELNKKIDALQQAAEKKEKAEKQAKKTKAKKKAATKAAEKAVQETIEEALQEVAKKDAQKAAASREETKVNPENLGPADEKTEN